MYQPPTKLADQLRTGDVICTPAADYWLRVVEVFPRAPDRELVEMTLSNGSRQSYLPSTAIEPRPGGRLHGSHP